jgi:tRNA (cytidine32/guanosine34-2'-O)-methyltransferase
MVDRLPQLIHLNEIYDFLHDEQKHVIDLCAAPGSWSQVLSRILPSDAKIVAVDLQPMAPLSGVTQIIGDITTLETSRAVQAALGGDKAGLIICDGAPDVTGLHMLDEFLQSQLLASALSITLQLLEKDGIFIAKILCRRVGASSMIHDTSSLLVAQLQTYFDQVDVVKPRSSRASSAEHFVICRGFLATSTIPSSFALRGDLSAEDGLN